MKKRYWFILAIWETKKREKITGNFGFVSDDENPFCNASLKEKILKIEYDIIPESLVITHFQEFKTLEDYTNFWKK